MKTLKIATTADCLSADASTIHAFMTHDDNNFTVLTTAVVLSADGSRSVIDAPGIRCSQSCGRVPVSGRGSQEGICHPVLHLHAIP